MGMFWVTYVTAGWMYRCALQTIFSAEVNTLVASHKVSITHSKCFVGIGTS